MLVYTLLIALSMIVLLSWLNLPTVCSKETKLLVTVLFVGVQIFLFILYEFRGIHVGTDNWAYHEYFFKPTTTLKQFGIERGYVWLYEVGHKYESYDIVQVSSYLFTFVGAWIYAKRRNIPSLLYTAMLILSYLYFTSFNMVRQLAAIGIVFGALSIFVSSKRPVRFGYRYLLYAIIICLASLLHSSALIALIFPLFLNTRISARMVAIVGSITTIGFFADFGSRVVPLILKLVPYYLQKYGTSSNDFFSANSKGIVEFLPVVIQFIILFGVELNDVEFSKKYHFESTLYLVYLFLFIGSGSSSIIRIQYYLAPIVIYYYSLYILHARKNFGRFHVNIIKVGIILFLVLYALLRVARNVGGIIPYTF